MGFSYGWENAGFDALGPTIWVGHWYESWSASGSQRVGYLRVPLTSRPSAEVVTSAALRIPHPGSGHPSKRRLTETWRSLRNDAARRFHCMQQQVETTSEARSPSIPCGRRLCPKPLG